MRAALIVALVGEHPPMPMPLAVALGISIAAFMLVVGGLVLLWLDPLNRRAHYVAWAGVVLGAVSIAIRVVYAASGGPPL